MNSPKNNHDAELILSPHPEDTILQRTQLEPQLTHSPGAPPPKIAKRRAPQACQSCRARKIRCNVTKHGVPCVHCMLDEVECVVSESKRKR